MTQNNAAKVIADARRNGQKLSDYPCEQPASSQEAFTLQDAVSASFGEKIAGWKIGCTSLAAQQVMKTDGPFYGPIFASHLTPSGAQFKIADHDLRIVEAEVALTLAHDLAPRPDGYALADMESAIDTAHPALELVNRRLPGDITAGVNWAIADGGLNDALVLGAGTHEVPIELFPDISVSVFLNGTRTSTGIGSNALNGAQHALLWLANALSKRGHTLYAGDVVTTGLTTDIVFVKPGDSYEAVFSELGSVTATFV